MFVQSNTVRCVIGAPWTVEQYLRQIPLELHHVLPVYVWGHVAHCAEARVIYAGFDWIIYISDGIGAIKRPTMLHGHKGPVYSLAVQGNVLASAGGEGFVGLWDLITNALLCMLPSGNTAVSSVAIQGTAFHTMLAAVGWDGFLRVWNQTNDLAYTPRYTVLVTEHRHWLLQVLLANTCIVTCNDVGTIYLLDYQSGTLLHTIAASFVSRVAITLCHEWLVAHYLNGQISVVDLQVQTATRIIWSAAGVMAVYSNHAYLIATYLDNTVYAWDTATKKPRDWSFIGKFNSQHNIHQNVHATIIGHRLVYAYSNMQLHCKSLKNY